MQEIYDLLIALLGKDFQSSEYESLVQKCGQLPIVYEFEGDTHYNSPSLGISFTERNKNVWLVGVDFLKPTDHEIASFLPSTKFYKGIQIGDSPELVSEKLAAVPIRQVDATASRIFEYEDSSFNIRCAFSTENNRVTSVCVHFKPHLVRAL